MEEEVLIISNKLSTKFT